MSAIDQRTIGPSNPTWGLFLISVLGLYLEMLLIRWLATEVRILAYLQNVVLVVCFLGLGMGCFSCREPIRFGNMLRQLLVLAVLFAIPFSREGLSKISAMISTSHDFVIWHQGVTTDAWRQVLYIIVGLGVVFLLLAFVWDMFVPIGRLLGRLLDDHPRTIWAYSVNVAGGLLGIWLFVLLSVFHQPPVIWMAAFAALALPFLGASRRERTINASMLVGIVALAWLAAKEPGAQEVRWSPYQKLVLTEKRGRKKMWPGKYLISVNNTGYQGIIDLSPESVRSNPDIEPSAYGLSQYDIPLLLHPSPKRVLMVGAGSGNDAAGALRNGAQRVTAVEIDPVILSMGRRHHPERPYSSDAVTVVNDDARSYFATCQDRFDLIVFGLLDSHTTVSGATNARLDHYVYTKESITHARSLLADRGVVVLSFEALPYVADRMARVLRDVFKADPMVFRVPPTSSGWGGVMFVTGDQESIQGCLSSNSRLASQIAHWQKQHPIELTYTTPVTTDDWPYVYLDRPRIPVLFFLMAALLLLLFQRGRRRLTLGLTLRDWSRSHWHFFFLGAAFMLLEVQNISKASVVLGSTWWVNAVIVSGVLIMVLLANAVAARFPKLPLTPAYVALCATCLALYCIDLSSFGFLPYASKALIVGSLTTMPMLFSGIVFVRSFVSAPEKSQALGANMFGALVGGLLQSVAFITGIKALLLLVAGLYLLAFVTRMGVRAKSPLPARA